MAEWIVEAETLEDLENGFYTIGNNGEPVVRCEDCKFYKQLDGDCPYLGEDGYYNCFPDKDDFCSKGERKDDEE